ncbi:flagellar protein FlgN [Myxococcota bacterium]|nr:flagellar protein FlgN [Myxococcota bacterium]
MKRVDEQVAGLEVVLRAEENVYLRLREVLRREEGDLIALDPGAIAEIVERKRGLAEEARLLEDSRRALTTALVRALGLGEQPIKLGALIDALDGEAGGLPELHARLRALVQSTRALLESNGSFADRSLRHIQDTLRMLGRAVPEKVGYGPAKLGAGSMGRGRLVRAAI